MSGEAFFVTYEKQKYNIASFLSKHPGGSEILQEYKDKDLTTAYDEINHSEEAKEIMKRYLVVENQSTNATTNKDANTDNTATTKKERRPNDFKSQIKHAYEKLVTKEDKNFLHKIFGFTSLALFTYRYSYFFKNGTLGFDGQLIDYLTLLVHFLLSFSSLIFHVLEKRLESNPLIIYEEYRLHAIVFSGRAVGVSLFGMSTYINSLTPMVRQALLIAFILTIHLVVDFITYKYGTQGVTAVRVNNKDKSLKGLKLFFAFYQFMALASHLVLDEKLNDLGYNTLIAIQSSAFLMTLKRKGIIRWYSHLFWYSLALFFSISYMLYVKGFVFFAFVSFFFYLRVELNLSKYLVWTYYLFGYFFFDFYQFKAQISSDFLFSFLK